MEVGSILFIVLLLIFAGVGIFLVYTGLTVGQKRQPSMTWPDVKGKVLSSEIVESSGFDESGQPVSEYKSVVRFRYMVAGKECTSIQIGTASRDKDAIEIRKMVELYPVGKKVTVYYDPQNPNETIIPPHIPAARSVVIAGVVLILIAGSGACIGFILFLIYFFTH